jgi:thiol-disulfide isomerase/thioredoxin
MGGTVALAAGAAGLGLWLGNRRSQSEGGAFARLNEVQLFSLEGEITKLQSLLKKRTLINFWATWCPPCVAEMPLINSIYNEFASKNLQVIGVAVDKRESVQKFVLEKNIQFPVLIGSLAGMELSKHFGNKMEALPYSVLVDESAQVLESKMGEISEKELRYWLNKSK